MLARLLLPISLIGLALAKPAGASSPPGAPAVDPATIYRSRCGSCHAPDQNRVGPKHRGVVGRKSGSVPGYAYSPALKAAGIVWSREELDKWLQGPRKRVAGTRMVTAVADPTDRRAIIDYLETLR
ncbi:MAG: cytochrome C [Sphingomonadaceae bacterium]|nr:cytochrome C [Sphingomonadaceae bacterium]